MATVTASKRNAQLLADSAEISGNLVINGNISAPSYNNTNWDTAYSWGDHSTQNYATQGYVTTQLNNLVDSAPGTLDTLNELAAALGDDPNFAATVSANIGAKVSKSGDTMTGTLTVPNLTIGSGNKIKFANNDYIRYDDANGVGRYHFDSDGGTNNASVQAATFIGALSGNATTASSAAKWTTARSHTVTLTGDVTGSATQAVDGTGNKTWSLSSIVLAPTPGDWWNGGFAKVGTDGVMEIGKYIDWHDSDTETSDFSARLTNNGAHLYASGRLYANNNQRVFADDYHPNADKWTTARTNTVTLTGSVTGTGSASVDGSGNWTVTVPTTTNHTHNYDNYGSWTAQDDDGTSYTVTSGDTLKFAEGSGLNVNFTADDVLTIGINGNEIPGSVNLNTYRTTGYYCQNSNADATSGSNYPVNAAGILQVINDDYGNGVHSTQLYAQYNTSDYYIRNYYNGTWSSWRNLTQDTTYTVGNGAMSITAGSGLTGGGQVGTANQTGSSSVTINHADTSSQGSVNNSNGTVIQDISLDGFGHITDINSVNLDSRYLQSYTETDTLQSVCSRGSSTNTNVDIGGGLTIAGSLTSGGIATASNYKTGADNIILKGNSVGRSGIFFESEKDGTNINHTSDFGFIQYHAYGTATTGEANELIIGVSNDGTDNVILNAPDVNGLKFRTGVSTTDYTIWHAGNFNPSSYSTTAVADGRYVRKTGDTMTGTLTIDTGGNSTDALVIRGDAPTISFIDQGSSDDFYLHVNSNNFYVLRDTAGLDIVGTGYDTPHPLQLEGDTNIGLLFGNRMFADNYHPNADKWTTARTNTVTLTGDVTGTGSASVDGSGNWTVSVPTVVANNSHEHDHIQGSSYSNTDLNTIANAANPGELHYDSFSSSAPNKPPTADNANGVITVGQHSGNYNAQLAFSSNGNMYWRDNPTSSFGSWRKIYDSSHFDISDYDNRSVSDGRYVNVTGDTMTGALTIGTTNDAQLYLTSPDTWTGIGFNDSGNNNEFIWHNGTTGTFAIGGGGSAVSGKKLHVDGGMTIGVNYDSTATNTNGLVVEGDITTAGLLTATQKSFTIDHPTKEGHKLRYGSLEGPENGVYVRGRLKDDNTIELPEYWKELVHEDSITVNLTAIGKGQDIWVEDFNTAEIVVGGENVNCFYTVYGERKDVDKLITEFKEVE